MEKGVVSFEDFKHQNGITYWWASELGEMLGYSNIKDFQSAINKGTKALISLGIPYDENIISTFREINGENCKDYKLTRFACYIITMNANPKYEQVASAQRYFAEKTRQFEIYIESHDQIERIAIRDELTEGNKSLSSVAKAAGVFDYAKFQNAGYMGMYNMPNWKLATYRGVEKDKLIDKMGRTELAANLFRITQTEERIKSHNVRGQQGLEETHYDVGREVREMVIKNTSKKPEQLPQEKEIKDVKRELKQGYKKMLKQDK